MAHIKDKINMNKKLKELQEKLDVIERKNKKEITF